MKRILSLLLSILMLLSITAGLDFSAVAGSYDTIETARSMSLNTTYNGAISDSDGIDFYKFTITSSSTVNWKFIGSLKYVYLDIYNSDGGAIWNGSYDANSSGQISLDESICLTKGIYYFKVSKKYSATGNYTIKINAVSAGESFTETGSGTNNTLSTANTIVLGTTYTGQIAHNDDCDFYKFTITSSSTVNWKFIGSLKYVYLDIYNSDGSAIWNGSYDANSSAIIDVENTFSLDIGTYYLKISKRYEATGKYQFLIDCAHQVVIDKAVPATCQHTGLTEGSHCSVCGKVLVEQTVTPIAAHKQGNTVKENEIAATYEHGGSYDLVTYCTVCGKELSRTAKTTDKLVKNGWVKENNKWYYYKNNVAQTGWIKSGSTWYYMNSSGAMVTGWQRISNVWYYFNASGAMVTGWQKVGSVWYYFKSSGAMVTGWQKVGGTWYYFQSSGAMQTGWLKSGGKWYYFESSGAMLANTSRKISGKTYKFNSSGACTNP